jgi:hypothetical protein
VGVAQAVAAQGQGAAHAGVYALALDTEVAAQVELDGQLEGAGVAVGGVAAGLGRRLLAGRRAACAAHHDVVAELGVPSSGSMMRAWSTTSLPVSSALDSLEAGLYLAGDGELAVGAYAGAQALEFGVELHLGLPSTQPASPWAVRMPPVPLSPAPCSVNSLMRMRVPSSLARSLPLPNSMPSTTERRARSSACRSPAS